MKKKKFIHVDLKNKIHCSKVLELLSDYMEDKMGNGKPMPVDLGPKIIEGLNQHAAYIGFFVCIEKEFVALANCNLNYSTWQAKPLINIHDFIVSASYRNQGIGTFLLNEIEIYAKENGCCKLNLEVRQDNPKAQNLYKKVGFKECEPPMFFWQKKML